MNEQKKDFQITQIPEEAYTQSMITIGAMRQELLVSRQYIEKLKQAQEEGRGVNTHLVKALEEREEQRATAVDVQEATQRLLGEAQERIQVLEQSDVAFGGEGYRLVETVGDGDLYERVSAKKEVKCVDDEPDKEIDTDKTDEGRQ